MVALVAKTLVSQEMLFNNFKTSNSSIKRYCIFVKLLQLNKNEVQFEQNFFFQIEKIVSMENRGSDL